MPNCYYYDEQSNRCNCYVNENLNELLDGHERATARRVTTYRDEGRATGRTTCSECGGAVGQHDRCCKHCGAHFGREQ